MVWLSPLLKKFAISENPVPPGSIVNGSVANGTDGATGRRSVQGDLGQRQVPRPAAPV